ncbi:MAG: hypothetical protein ABII90_06285 [Bacteroidota bacterium]
MYNRGATKNLYKTCQAAKRYSGQPDPAHNFNVLIRINCRLSVRQQGKRRYVYED